MKDVGVQTDPLPPAGQQGSPWLRWAILGLVLAFTWPFLLDLPLFLFDVLQGSHGGFRVPADVLEDMGMDGVLLFKRHDRDDDGKLSLEEFEPLAHRLLEINITDYELPIDDSDEVVTIEVDFEPLVVDTMTSKGKPVTSQLGLDSMIGLKQWKGPRTAWKNFGVGHFLHLLPEDGNLEVGHVYWWIEAPEELVDGPPLSANRYEPPLLTHPRELLLHSVLEMAHSRPFLLQRFGPQGSVACVRAVNARSVEIAFRLHAEYQLNDPPMHPFWFTPAQFIGRLVLSRSGNKLIEFEMEVPNKRKLNVDMEWMNSIDEEIEVDIAYLPLLRWHSTRSSLPVKMGAEDLRTVHLNASDEAKGSLKWDQEITYEDAARKMEQLLYPFKEVMYYNLSDALPIAQEQHKPVHGIFLWGALDDQSC